MITDPIADFLTRIRNANIANLETVDAPASRVKANIARVLKEEGYVKNFRLIRSGSKHFIRVYLKQDAIALDKKRALTNLRRESRPGLRRYVDVSKIPNVLNGAGTVILSTPNGVMTGREAKKQRVGGEWLCSVW